MKIKSILICIVIVVIVFLIYLSNLDKKIYYVSINDYQNNSMKKYDFYIKNHLEKAKKLEYFIDDFSSSNLRITDVLNNLEKNIEISKDNKKISIKHALIKADLLTLYLGNNDLIYKINNIDDSIYDYIDEIINDYDKLLDYVRKYCKEKIILIGSYFKTDNEDIKQSIKYYNKKLKDVTNKYDIIFIDVNNKDLFDTEKIYPNESGYKYISNLIIKNI